MTTWFRSGRRLSLKAYRPADEAHGGRVGDLSPLTVADRDHRAVADADVDVVAFSDSDFEPEFSGEADDFEVGVARCAVAHASPLPAASAASLAARILPTVLSNSAWTMLDVEYP